MSNSSPEEHLTVSIRWLRVALLRRLSQLAKAFCNFDYSSSFGVLNLSLGRRVYKIEMSPHALEETLRREAVIPAVARELFCPLSVYRIAGRRVVSMPRLNCEGDDQQKLPHARLLLDRLKSLARRQSCRYEEFPELVAGLERLGRYVDERSVIALQERLSEIFAREHLVGLCHGDFHARNIGVDEQGLPKMFDTDCLRLRGLPVTDAVYYAVEAASHSRTQLVWWIDELAEHLKGRSELGQWVEKLGGLDGIELNDALVLHLVDRVGQDHRFLPAYSDRHGEVLAEIASILSGTAAT